MIDPAISALALVRHYHQRWDIELCLDELKTHQCATLRGQLPTLFRSKRPELVEQELYALLITYNLIRELMMQAAKDTDTDPRCLSFLACLHLIIDAVPQISKPLSSQQQQAHHDYLLLLLRQATIDRPRRQRDNPRVVKVKMSKFKRKTRQHRSSPRVVDRTLQIIPPEEAT